MNDKEKESARKKQARAKRSLTVEYVLISGRKRKLKLPITALDVFKERLEIDKTSKSGLRWKNVEANSCAIRGKEAGSIRDKKNKYYCVCVTFNSNDYKIQAANIVWMLAFNKLIDDDKIIDHKNGLSTDNSVENLDMKNTSQNHINRSSWNKSGYKNVCKTVNNTFVSVYRYLGRRYSCKIAKTPYQSFIIGWELMTSGSLPLECIKSQPEELLDGSELKRALAECKKQGIAVTPPKYKTLYEYIASVEGSC
jgi:hypothetical protein